MRPERATVPLAVCALAALALPALGCGSSPARPAAAAHTAHAGRAPAAGAPTTSAVAALGSDPSVVGLVLSGRGASLYPPLSPTDKAYKPDCHLLIDPGFTGRCALAAGAQGTVAGVVEEETAALEGRARTGPAGARVQEVQERDLVWRHRGRSWALVLRRVFNSAGVPTRLWVGDVQAARSPDLVFVTPSDGAGFGNELDVVDGVGTVSLYRFLGEGFVVAPGPGELVAYVPGWTEQRPVKGAYDQTLIGYSSGSWRVVSQQYVPDAAALAQHHGPFRDATVVPAS